MPRCWFEYDCPVCGNPNLVDAGEINDLTIEGIGGFTCWSCQKISEMADDDGETLHVCDEPGDWAVQGFPLPRMPEYDPEPPKKSKHPKSKKKGKK